MRSLLCVLALASLISLTGCPINYDDDPAPGAYYYTDDHGNRVYYTYDQYGNIVYFN
jgi:hypothetical protein